MTRHTRPPRQRRRGTRSLALVMASTVGLVLGSAPVAATPTVAAPTVSAPTVSAAADPGLMPAGTMATGSVRAAGAAAWATGWHGCGSDSV